ncbi:MAG: hypothetical protein LBH32_03640 [Dysgonamonadaceae bacterium]|jgi:hypothetical protein|nr:hypothetical protein [Dysgonamonadaceae bacterium]
MKRLSFFVTFFVLLSVTMLAEPGFFGAKPVWEKKEAQNFPFMGQHVTRNITFGIRGGQKKLYAVSRLDAPNIHVINAETGDYNPDDVLLYDELVVQGGHFVLSAAGITDDNILIACSMSSNLSGDVQRIFRVYTWDTDESEARLLINVDNIVVMSDNLTQATNTNTRIGDKMTVTGSMSDGTAKLYFPNFDLQTSANNPGLHPTIYVFSMIPDGNGGFKFNETPTLIDVPINNLAGCRYASVSVLADGSYFWSSQGNLIYYINANGEIQAYTSGGIVGAEDASVKYICKTGNVEYLAYCRSDHQRAEIIKVINGNVFDCVRIGYSARMADNSSYPNDNGTGDLALDLSTPVPTLFVLCTNQGIGAYKLMPVTQYDMSNNIEIVWEQPTIDSEYARLHDFLWSGAYSDNKPPYVTRDIALANHDGKKILYVINALTSEYSGQFGIYAIDALTGEVIKNSNDENLKLKLPEDAILDQGSQRIWSAATTEDDVLLVANAASEGKKFNIYAYESSTADPILALSYTVPAGVNLGDYGKISVIGKFRDGTARLYVTDNTFTGDDAAGTVQAKVYVFSMKQEGDLIFDDSDPLVVAFNAGSSKSGNRTWFQNLCVSALKNGTFLWDDTFFPLRHVDLQGNVKSEVNKDLLPERANNGRYIGIDAQSNRYAAYFEYQSGKAEIYKSPVDNLSGNGCEIIANTNSYAYKSYFFFNDGDNYYYDVPESIEAAGGIVIDKEEDGKPVVYLMAQNRGIGAYRLKDITIIEDPVLIKNPDSSNRQAVVSQWGDVLKVTGVDVASMEIYSATGQRLAVSKRAEISVAGLHGVLLVKVKTVAGNTEVCKWIVK